ncbi:MAG TPA: lysophospholipid acyltransferase family protein [Blastocatellia bacterium]|nr:lysophospholipid acyltransferase family protein [Blastocatellia bacterium]
MARTIYETPILNTALPWLADKGLRLFGWRMEGRKPDLDKFVLIAAPHTSNWDVLVMLGVAFAFRAELFWIGKDSLFRGPFNALLRWLGGIPIDRSGGQNLVAKTAELFAERDKLILAIAPEGTRKKVRHWKTGFYYIAHTAGVPIVMGFIDFQRKVAGVGPTLTPTGDIEADMQKLQAFYANIAGKHQEQSGLADVAPR